MMNQYEDGVLIDDLHFQVKEQDNLIAFLQQEKRELLSTIDQLEKQLSKERSDANWIRNADRQGGA